MAISTIDPHRGEIRWVQLDPTRGAEIRYRRPTLVLNQDGIAILPLRLVVPITDWHGGSRRRFWHVPIDPTPENGLTKPSCADVFQTRGLDLARFESKIGRIPEDDIQRVLRALSLLTLMRSIP